MMTAFNGVRVGRWTINRPLLLLALLAPLALTGCPATTPSNNTEPTTGDPLPGAGDNVAPSPLLDTPDGTLAQGDTLQGQVGIALFFDAAGSVDSDGAVTGYEWDFGDGSPLETEASVTHSYAEPGEYTVALTVIDNAGQRTTLTITVVISGADPVASFTATPTSGQAPLTVDFDASASSDSDGVIVAYAWDPGDGSGPFGGVTLGYTYETGGTFTATLTVDDNDGNSGSMSIDIEVQAANQVPLAVLAATPLTGFEPLTVEFDATGSSDPDGTIVTYQWDFGDDSDLGAGASTSHDYTTAGTYTAELTVTDNEGATASTPVDITVEVTNLTPTAMIGADPTSGTAPLTVTFDAAGSSDPEDGADDLKYLWDFGESTCVDSGGINLGTACTSDSDCPSEATCNPITATDTPTPVHTYDVEGLYTTTLVVFDSANQASATVSIDIEVTVLEVVVVSLAVDTTCLELDPTNPTETYALLVTGTLSDASELDLTDDADTIYASDDATVATVDATGLITAVVDADGIATVTVSHTDPAVLPVEVTVHVSAVTLYESLLVTSDPDAEDLVIGQTSQLTVNGVGICDPLSNPDLTADGVTSYASDDMAIATVDEFGGEITAEGVGSTFITVSRSDFSAPDVTVPVAVTLVPLDATIEITSGDDDGDGIVLPGDVIGLDVLVNGGTEPFTYDWNVDASGTTDGTVGDEVFTPDDAGQMVTFTPPLGVEGTYLITCIVTDDLGAEGIPSLSIIATTLSPSAVVLNLPTEGHFHPGMIVELDLDIQGGIGDPETDDFTYDWNLDVTGAPGSSLTDSDFVDQDTRLTSFVPDVEGDFVVNCTVTDNVGTLVTTSDLTITVIALTAEPIVMGNDGCIVGPPSGITPPGADGPGTIQEEYTFATLEANVSGQLGELNYLWSATANEEDFGTFDDPTLATPAWTIPMVAEDTEVVFTVMLSDDAQSMEFDSEPWTVSPPLELSEIQYLGPAQEMVDFPVTFIREEESGTTPRILRFRDLPDGVTVGGDCVEGGGVTDFDQPVLACTLTFPSAGDYTMTVGLKDWCADQTQGSPKPLISYDFTVNVVP
ncbi:MAG: PKD domain-containing protein [Planctomycetes bacterium]|nr:PKD domain-containing protein [Planctomycetota bacterium]